ncbi:MAG: carbon-nitrogen hydrolase family protein [Gammaproteobacteria bacterium]
MTNTIRVAAIQMVSTVDVDANLDSARTLIAQAAGQGAKLAVLPEYFPVLSDDETVKLRYREPYGNGPLQEFLADNARQQGIWLMGGSIPLESEQEEHIYNSCLLFNPEGECVARYDKMHLFDVCVNSESDESYNESNTIMAGNNIIIAATPFANIGMSICYDLRFPELYRNMIDQDVSIITIPAAFTETTGRRHWKTMLRTRAIENLCFVIAPNQGGQHTEKRFTWGHSMIIDPWGEVLGSLEKGPGIVCADLDLGRQQELRASFPVLQHKKLIQ